MWSRIWLNKYRINKIPKILFFAYEKNKDWRPSVCHLERLLIRFLYVPKKKGPDPRESQACSLEDLPKSGAPTIKKYQRL